MKLLSMPMCFALAAIASCNALGQESRPPARALLLPNGEGEQRARNLKMQMPPREPASDDLALARSVARDLFRLAKGDDEELTEIALLQLDLGDLAALWRPWLR